MRRVPRSLVDDHVRRLRLRAQRLDATGSTPSPPVVSTAQVSQIVRDVAGLQAQDERAAALSVRVRGAGLTATDVERARVEERSVVRLWCMRGTLHLVAAEDVGWLLALLGPLFQARDRRRRLQLGLDDAATARGVRLVQDALAARGPLTREELRHLLAQHELPAEGQATIHLLSYAALGGVICQGPDRHGAPTFVLQERWLGQQAVLPRDAALRALARRYLAAYGPATLDDFVAWSGLPANEARTGWQQLNADAVEVHTSGGLAWVLNDQVAWLDERRMPSGDAPVVRLLPAFDAYLLGYRGRDLAVAPEYARRIHPGGGLLHPVVLVDGRALGTWRLQMRRRAVQVVIEPFTDLAPDVVSGLEAEAHDIGRFLGLAATVDLVA